MSRCRKMPDSQLSNVIWDDASMHRDGISSSGGNRPIINDISQIDSNGVITMVIRLIIDAFLKRANEWFSRSKTREREKEDRTVVQSVPVTLPARKRSGVFY